MGESNISKDFNEKYLESYRQEQSDPTNENHHFDSNTAAENGEVNNPATTAAAQLAESTFKPSDVMAFGYPVMDFIHARLPNGATEGSRHNTAIKLAYDLMLICDADTEKVRMLMLQLQWVNDITTERGMKELDDILDAAKKLMPTEDFEDRRIKAQKYQAMLGDKSADMGEAPMTPTEFWKFIEESNGYNKLLADALNDFGSKEVDVEFDALTEDAFGKLMASNEWNMAQVTALGDIICE